MTIENELREFLQKQISDKSKEKKRDIELIVYYYGFKEDIKPTLVEAAVKYEAGETRQNAELILNGKFRNVPDKDLPSAIKCAEMIASQEIISSTKLYENMRSVGLADSEVNMVGLLRLLNEVGLAENYEICTPELDEATKNNYRLGDNSFLIEKNILPEIKEDVKKAETLAGQRGFASFTSLKDEIGKDSDYFERIVEILKANNNFWSSDFEGETYYLFESLGKTLFNMMQKILYISDTVELNQLARTLRQSIRVDKPPLKIIEKYLGEENKYTTPDGENVKLKFHKRKSLSRMENAVVELLRVTPFMDFSSLKSKLQEKIGEDSDDNIRKNLFNSPLVYKSGNPKSFRYSLIGESSKNRDERRAKFEQWFEEFKDDTDREQLVTARREQYALRKWLFDERDKENCAICGEEFSVELLWAAHKKKRKDCTDDERKDVFIVMPLCLFGCDAMYEKRYLRIQEGKVVKGESTENLTEKEKSFIESVVTGKPIDDRWLEGSATYFE